MAKKYKQYSQKEKERYYRSRTDDMSLRDGQRRYAKSWLAAQSYEPSKRELREQVKRHNDFLEALEESDLELCKIEDGGEFFCEDCPERFGCDRIHCMVEDLYVSDEEVESETEFIPASEIDRMMKFDINQENVAEDDFDYDSYGRIKGHYTEDGFFEPD